ncbi:histidine protein methyltransferase 1 homolog [Brienomyrus brachyistius]|uniref:histidine protein methyltransferase 1 homolog n=1 Tax=Brienomyrus brachyistius TaxID=42636 RepID=UPI0020B259CB|nr:histidine protein methyltransferase 1 homolog [Brienomyrus brachyistius]
MYTVKTTALFKLRGICVKMAFSFNFDVQINTKEPSDADSNEKDRIQMLPDRSTDAEDAVNDAGLKVKPAVEHNPKSHPSLFENSVFETLCVGSLPPLHYLNETVFETTTSVEADSEKILSQTAALHSDLISGVYEGGLKIWECTYDLLEYIEAEGVSFVGKKVLDLGCGAGLLGIAALKMGASDVHFQDYNSTVVDRLTIPTVLLNCEDSSVEEDDGSPSSKKRATDLSQHPQFAKCRFFSGDWAAFLPLMVSRDTAPKYDIILTSETIYNTAYYAALHQVFHKLLDSDGVIYLATKSHYFGVGGGLLLFQKFVEERAVFGIRCVRDVEQGLQRHVVALSFKK